MKGSIVLENSVIPTNKIIKLEPRKEKGEEKKWEKYLTKKERKNLKIKDENLTTKQRLKRIGILLKRVDFILSKDLAA